MHNLINLPTDVQAHIVCYIGCQEDLRNLYQTCKDLYHVAIARVYHSITLNEHCSMWLLTGLLRPENEGLQHIRHLTIKSCSNMDCQCECDGNSDDVLLMLAQLLPKDTILTLRSVIS